MPGHCSPAAHLPAPSGQPSLVMMTGTVLLRCTSGTSSCRRATLGMLSPDGTRLGASYVPSY